jgi:hypothetical protein
MKLEEYICKRKKEDGINEYNFENRLENMKICANYVFEYFSNYLETKPMDEKTLLHEQKIDKYCGILREYDSEIQEWLVFLYASHGKYMHRQLRNFITNDYFLLFDSEAEFRALSYEIYPKIAKKFKFLDGQSEMVYLFIKDEHKVRSLVYPYNQDYFISEELNEWIDDTYKKHGVNIYNFCYEWVNNFYSCPEIWPKGHKQKSKYYDKRDEYDFLEKPMLWNYDYKQKNNLFNLDSLYRNMPKKSFIRGKKQEFETVLMYCWLHEVIGDDIYWDIYVENVL